jgi:hypothetical protein
MKRYAHHREVKAALTPEKDVEISVQYNCSNAKKNGN